MEQQKKAPKSILLEDPRLRWWQSDRQYLDNTPLPLLIIFWARYLDIYTKHRMDLNIVSTQNIGNTFLH